MLFRPQPRFTNRASTGGREDQTILNASNTAQELESSLDQLKNDFTIDDAILPGYNTEFLFESTLKQSNKKEAKISPKRSIQPRIHILFKNTPINVSVNDQRDNSSQAESKTSKLTSIFGVFKQKEPANNKRVSIDKFIQFSESGSNSSQKSVASVHVAFAEST